MYSKEEMKGIKAYIWDVEDMLNTSSRDHHLSMAYGKPAGTSESEWQAAIDAEGARLDKQWSDLRALKKQYGIK
jgi:hypothetical protein